MKPRRFVIFAFIIAGVLAGMALQSASIDVFEQFAITDDRVFGLLSTSSLVGLVGGVVTFFSLARNPKVMRFSGEVISELFKVTWPSRDETVRATTTVVLTTFFVAALLAVYDFFWKNLADAFLFTQG